MDRLINRENGPFPNDLIEIAGILFFADTTAMHTLCDSIHTYLASVLANYGISEQIASFADSLAVAYSNLNPPDLPSGNCRNNLMNCRNNRIATGIAIAATCGNHCQGGYQYCHNFCHAIGAYYIENQFFICAADYVGCIGGGGYVAYLFFRQKL